MSADNQANNRPSRKLHPSLEVWIALIAVALIADFFTSPICRRFPLCFTSIAVGGLLIYSGVRKSSIHWVEVIPGLAILILGPIVALNSENVTREKAPMTTCLSNVKQLSLALIVYAEDNDGVLPEADRWVEAISPLVRNQEAFKCPQDTSAARCSYAFNENLEGEAYLNLDDPSTAIMLYETTSPGDNPSGTGADILRIGRHQEGTPVAFGDGHVQWIEQDDIIEEYRWRPPARMARP